MKQNIDYIIDRFRKIILFLERAILFLQRCAANIENISKRNKSKIEILCTVAFCRRDCYMENVLAREMPVSVYLVYLNAGWSLKPETTYLYVSQLKLYFRQYITLFIW